VLVCAGLRLTTLNSNYPNLHFPIWISLSRFGTTLFVLATLRQFQIGRGPDKSLRFMSVQKRFEFID